MPFEFFFLLLISSISLSSGQNNNKTSSASCGCCPAPRCDSTPFSCSSNIDCDCLLMTINGGGLCANVVVPCSTLTPCQSDNKTCSVPNTICVNNTRCNGPVCYPIALATPQMCPPLSSRNGTTHASTTTTTTTTTKTTTIARTTSTTSIVTSTSTRTTTTAKTTSTIKTTTTSMNPCSNGTRCLNGGTCQSTGIDFYCICPTTFYGTHCEKPGSPTDLGVVDEILNGSNTSYEQTVENVLNRNNWTNIVAVIDVTGSMLPCAAAVYKWITLAFERANKINYYVFFNDGDSKNNNNKPIGSAGGLYGIENSDLDKVLNTMKTAMKNGNGGDGPENDIEAILFGIKQCPNCSNVVHVADNQVVPRDMVLLERVTKPVKVIVCQLNNNPLNVNLMNIATSTNGSIHTLEQDIINLSGIPINGTIVIGTLTYRRTASGYIIV